MLGRVDNAGRCEERTQNLLNILLVDLSMSLPTVGQCASLCIWALHSTQDSTQLGL